MLDVSIKKKLTGAGSGTFALDISFTAPEGTTILFGPSGSGKTTTLRCIAGILTPDEGRITLGERVYYDSSRNINLSVQQRWIGYVFQDYALFPHFTAEQNIAYGVRRRDDEGKSGRSASRAEKRERARELLALLEIEYAARRYPHQLSGGESQRVALARALASDPALMLLDEPLSAVDMSTRARLLKEICDVQRRIAVPFIYVTHNAAEAIEVGTRIILLDRGRILRQGVPRDVLTMPTSIADLPIADLGVRTAD